MKRGVKRLLAILLVACCIASTEVGTLSLQAADDTIFADDFSNGALQGWTSAGTGTVSEGVYNISGDGINLVSAPVTEDGYAVQSKVTLKKLAGSDISSAAIVIGADATAAEYYEFGLGITRNGTTYAYLYKNCANEENSSTVYQLSSSVPGTENGKILTNREYTLTAILKDGMISCLINGEKFTEVNLSVFGHYAGVVSNTARAAFDDFAVKRAGEKTISAIRLLNTPEEVTVNGGGLSFDIQIVYSGVYGVETIPSTTQGVSVTGFDGAVGEKTLTVSYGGVSAQFTTNMVAEPERKGIFRDTFDSGIDTGIWSLRELNPESGYNFNYRFQNASGAFLVEFPTNIGDYTNVITAKADLDNSILGDLKNYQVEMDATIQKSTTVTGGRAADAALDVAISGGKEYSYRVRADGTVILYEYTTIVAQSTISGFALGKTFHMKAEVYDGVILCYYNDECVLTYHSSELAAGKRRVDVGFRAVNGTVRFDNFVVKEIPERSVFAANRITIDDLQTEETDISVLEANYLDYGRYLVKLYYPDGGFWPLSFNESMLTGYTSGERGEQSVTLSYGPLSKRLTYRYTSVLFYDNWTSGARAEWREASDNYKGYITLNYNNGLQITRAADNVSSQIVQYVSMFKEYPDVGVSADVTMKPVNNSRVRRIGVRTRYEGGSCYEYAFSYTPTDGEFSLALFRYNSGTLTELKEYNEAAILKMCGLEDLYMGTTYNIAMECIGNQIFLYFNHEILDVYVDESENVVLSGSGAGYRAVNASGTINNFKVEEIPSRTLESISIPEIEGTLNLYQGFTISPYDNSLYVRYSDGTAVNMTLTADMIGEFDNITPGTQRVPITCLGTTTYVTVNIVERPEYIEEFTELVEACKEADEITLEDKAAVDELEEMYQSLSGYEISTIDEAVVKKYTEVVEALYKLENPELAEYDVVYVDDFNSDLVEADWSSFAQSARGTWRTVNGILVNEQERYGLTDGISFLEYTAFNGEVNSVEADVMLTNEFGCHASIVSCKSDLGYYHARITNEYAGDDGKLTFMIQLYKYVGSHQKLAETYAELRGLDIQVDEWHNLRLTNINGLLTVYVDDIKALEYDDSASQYCMTTGTFGFRSLYGDMRYDSLRVMGTNLTEEEYVPQIEPTYYEDDFEDEAEGTNPSHWIEETNTDSWRVYKKNDSLVYGTTSKALTYSWLHTFESDPTVTMDFMVENTGNTGRIEFLTRYTQAVYSYAGIGYDFSQSRWYIYTARGEDFEPKTLYADTDYELSPGEWYALEIKEEGANIQVYVNGELVIEEPNAYMTGYGRIGVLSENVNLYIDNLSYTMPHGGNVDDGVIEYIFDDEVYGYISHMEVESVNDGTLIGVNGTSNRFLSSDNGATWTKTSQYEDVRGAGLGYPSILEVSSGVHILVYGDTFEVYRSTDQMQTWNKIGQVFPEVVETNQYGSWDNLIHVNSLTKVTLDDGTERIFLPVGVRRYGDSGRYNGHYTRIFYSDDGGVTWTESANDTRDITPNYTDDINTFFSWCEAKIIKCSDGSLRMYQSRQYDCIVYTESFDGGITWEEIHSIPYLQNGQTSFSVAEDPENPGTYYMVCLNTKSESYNSAYPRNRLSLVKFVDGKNWEFITDIERFSSYGNYLSNELYQIIDPSISIIDGYLYVTMGRSYCGGEGHGEQSVLLVRLEMDKLPEASEWSDANIADPTRPETLEIETMPQTIFGLGDLFAIYGGELKVTAFNGNVSYMDLNELAMAEREPNMYEKGTYTVSLMNLYAQFVTYDIEVTDNYNITWNFDGNGDVTPYYAKIAKGLERVFTAVPQEGWRVKEVLVNGEAIEVQENQFSIVGSEDITVDIVFTEGDEPETEEEIILAGGFPTIAIVVIAVVAAAAILGGIGAAILIQKKRKVQGKKEE